jgi:hypothetical protein
MTSKIKVDNINKVSDDSNIIKKCGTTTTIGSGASNPIVVDGSAVTLGRCGGTVALASGATQTGFGRTGTVDWQTSSVKTATFTAANGEGYFANTSGGAFTLNLPAGTAGNIVSVVDYTNTFQTNSLTISPNGSQKIGGINASNVLSTEGQSVTFVYVDDTEGWKNVQDSTSNVTGNPNMLASGGTVTTCGNDKIHTFTGPGTFTVSSAAACASNNVVSYIVVAGGGGGGFQSTAGGGAGGFREDKSPVTPYTASPLDGAGAITVSAQAYPIVVGAGGAGSTGAGADGSQGATSTFSTISSAGGGGGGSDGSGCGQAGGSGGGGANGNGGGAGNTPPVSPSQGNQGGPSATSSPSGGGGGGAGAAGSPQPSNQGVAGGAGVATLINPASGELGPGPSRYYSGGGASGSRPGTSVAAGGVGGGGDGGSCNGVGTAGVANTGGGGGNGRSSGTGDEAPGRAGGSGIVVIRYKFQ